MSVSKIIQNFDAAAPGYDAAAAPQKIIAERLVAWAAQNIMAPQTVFDVGCGTGSVSTVANDIWPHATITALDGSPAMLVEAKRKLPQLETICGDLMDIKISRTCDLILSSMVLHWLPNPLQALARWQKWLNPHGKLFVVLPVAGSFFEWSDLCAKHSLNSGLLSLPCADFAQSIAGENKRETMQFTYASARAFLHAMKATGAATPHPGHKPASTAKLRGLLNAAPQPFTATYELAFLEIPAKCDP